VVAGTDPIDQRLTLLHELAHWLLPASARRRRRAPHHDRRFYEVAFGLYRSYGLTDAESLSREASHYPSSLRHARSLRIAGADEAWREHLLTLRRRRLARAPMRVLVPEHRVQLVRDGRWTVCAVCRQRIVGPNLARMRRRGGRHTLFIREAAS
jgi:RNase P subunit RPR2